MLFGLIGILLGCSIPFDRTARAEVVAQNCWAGLAGVPDGAAGLEGPQIGKRARDAVVGSRRRVCVDQGPRVPGVDVAVAAEAVGGQVLILVGTGADRDQRSGGRDDLRPRRRHVVAIERGLVQVALVVPRPWDALTVDSDLLGPSRRLFPAAGAVDHAVAEDGTVAV